MTRTEAKAEKMLAAFRALEAEYLKEGKEREAAAVSAARGELEKLSINIIARLHDILTGAV